MKIEFLTQGDPIYVLPFFEEFFRHHASEFEITRLSCCRVMGKRSRTKLLREMSWLYGWFGLARLLARRVGMGIEALLPHQRTARHFHSMQQLCRAYGVPCFRAGSPNEEQFVADLKARAPDVLVSVACPYILKEKLLNVPRLGCVNIHHAPLPRYKGMMPTFWQMYHGEKTVGVTVHYMVAKVDEGDALLQDQMAIEPGESLDSLIRRSKRQGAHLMAKALHAIESGTVSPIKLDLANGTYFTFPNREEALTFRQRGLRAI